MKPHDNGPRSVEYRSARQLADRAETLAPDLAAEHPVYLYLDPAGACAMWSRSAKALLEDARIARPLSLDREGLAFLLQSGVVPLPGTVFRDVRVLGVGDAVRLDSDGTRVRSTFSHHFPFRAAERSTRPPEPGIGDIALASVGEALRSRLDGSRCAVLFQSAGKDSNYILLAAHDAGLHDRLVCLSHQSEGPKDESGIAADIARRLGFRHLTVRLPERLAPREVDAIHRYFESIALPCLDNVALSYPIHVLTAMDHGDAIVDGMGNDVYIGHVPGRAEYERQARSRWISGLRWLSRRTSSTGALQPLGRTRAEWCGFEGLSWTDCRSILEDCADVAPHWRATSASMADWDYLDLRAAVRGRHLDQEVFLRKVRNAADAFDVPVVFPWLDERVARLFATMPESLLVDRAGLRNKLLLRRTLKERVGLDSDALGKLGYEFDYFGALNRLEGGYRAEIEACGLWMRRGVGTLLDRLEAATRSGDRRAATRGRLMINRLYLISAWHNRNRLLR